MKLSFPGEITEMQIDLRILTEDIEFQKEYWLQMEQWAETVAYYSIETKDWQEQLKQDETKYSVIALCLSEEKLPWKWVSKVKAIMEVPILVISEKESYYEEIQCFQNGADDYQGRRKPVPVLKERILRLLQRERQSLGSVLTQGGLVEELSSGQFFYKGESLGLTSKEAQVLHWLLHSQEQVIPRQKLLFHVWKKETQMESRALDTIMKQLRKKLAITNIEIKTCYGKGFQMIKR